MSYKMKISVPGRNFLPELLSDRSQRHPKQHRLLSLLLATYHSSAAIALL